MVAEFGIGEYQVSGKASADTDLNGEAKVDSMEQIISFLLQFQHLSRENISFMSQPILNQSTSWSSSPITFGERQLLSLLVADVNQNLSSYPYQVLKTLDLIYKEALTDTQPPEFPSPLDGYVSEVKNVLETTIESQKNRENDVLDLLHMSSLTETGNVEGRVKVLPFIETDLVVT